MTSAAIKHDTSKPTFTLIPWATLQHLDPIDGPNPITIGERWWRREEPDVSTLQAAAAATMNLHRKLFDQDGVTEKWRIADFIRPVLDFGARKYAPDNWRKGFLWSRPYDAFVRHVRGYVDGEGVFQGGMLSGVRDDQETGLFHAGHALCCITFLAHYQVWGGGEDNRPEAQ